MSKVALRSKPQFHRIPVCMSRVELGEMMRSIWPGAHKRVKGNRFRGNVGENLKRVSRNDLREVGDYSNAVPSIGSIV
jgi:hypothetical protein